MPSALGAGRRCDFQSMFLWNVAQNDFGKYDCRLIDAAMHQIGGAAAEAPAAAAAPAIPRCRRAHAPPAVSPSAGTAPRRHGRTRRGQRADL